MKLSITTGAKSLTQNSTLEEVQQVIEALKSYIPAWHRQDEEPIYWAKDVDWGARFACIMKDGSLRFASVDLDEGGDGSVSRYFDFIDLPDGTEYTDDDIDMWFMLPWDPRLLISGVEMDGRLVQKGPQSADTYKKAGHED